MHRHLLGYANMLVLGFLLAMLTSSVWARTAAEPQAQQPCPSGAGVQMAQSGQKTLIMPPTLYDSTVNAYSHGVRSGNQLFIAGQTGTLSGATQVVSFEEQTRRAFGSIKDTLEAAGGSLDDLVTMTVFITDSRYFQEFLRLRREILGRDFPASALIGVSHLANPEALLEIQAVAVLD
jgi:enamine deaminase RidA (YjgF/YER057c/UK114 family)